MTGDCCVFRISPAYYERKICISQRGELPSSRFFFLGRWVRLHVGYSAMCFQVGQFRVTLCLCFRTSLVQNISYEDEIDLHEKEHFGGTHFSYKWSRTKTRFYTGKRKLGNGPLVRRSLKQALVSSLLLRVRRDAGRVRRDG